MIKYVRKSTVNVTRLVGRHLLYMQGVGVQPS
jgi:hypothetical protein